jgi:hypothetical protein
MCLKLMPTSSKLIQRRKNVMNQMLRTTPVLLQEILKGNLKCLKFLLRVLLQDLVYHPLQVHTCKTVKTDLVTTSPGSTPH